MAWVETTAAAANLASLTAAMPKVADLTRAGAMVSLFKAEDLQGAVQNTRQPAHELVAAMLPADERSHLEAPLAQGDERCSQDWQCLRAAQPPAREAAPRAQGPVGRGTDRFGGQAISARERTCTGRAR